MHLQKSSTVTTVIVVDDHPVVREAVVEKVGRLSEFRVIGEAGSGRACIDLLTRVTPDVVILDLHLPREEGGTPTLLGPEIVDNIRCMDKAPRIVVFSGLGPDALELIAPKVDALISKSQSLRELCSAMSAKEMVPATALEQAGVFLRAYQDDLPSPSGTPETPWDVAQVWIQLNARVFQEELSLSALRDEGHMATCFSASRFRVHVGLGPKAYVQSHRLRAARLLLTVADLSREDLAHLVGFRSASALRKAERRLDNSFSDSDSDRENDQ